MAAKLRKEPLDLASSAWRAEICPLVCLSPVCPSNVINLIDIYRTTGDSVFAGIMTFLAMQISVAWSFSISVSFINIMFVNF